MSSLVVASTEADAAAVEAVRQHHAQLAGALDAQVDTLVAAVAHGNHETAEIARHRLAQWANDELVPHALAEEQAMYPRAHEDVRARLLVDAMLAEHRTLLGLVAAVGEVRRPVQAAALAEALRTLFHSHLAKENDQILPLLAQSPDVSLAELLSGMHELLDGHGHPDDYDDHDHDHDHDDDEHDGHAHHQAHDHHGSEPEPCGAECTCGEHGSTGLMPELDARSVPHAIRHATVFGALDAVEPGGGIVLIAPHDPLPLLRQLEKRSPGVFDVSYLERGPQAWRLVIARD